MEEDHEDYNYSSPPSTSMVDGTQTSWFQPHHSVQIQMDPESAQPQQHAHFNHLPPKFPPPLPQQQTKTNVSRNHSELIEGLKTESDQSSRPASRAGMRFVPEFLANSRIVNTLFGGLSNSSQTPTANLPHHHYQNYSNLTKHHHAQRANNPNTFLLKTPTKKPRYQDRFQQQQQSHQQPTTPLLNESSTNDLRTTRSNQANQSLLVNNTPFSMNASNASIGGNLNSNLNNFNTSLSATTMNNSQHLASSHQNLGSAAGNQSAAATGRSRPQRRNVAEHDDLTATDYDQRYESSSGRNHRNLRLNRTSTLTHPSKAKYSTCPTAPVLPTFNSSSSASSKNRMSPLMNRLRNSLNFSSSLHHYRNLNSKFTRTKRSSFSSAISLKSKCENPTSDQLVTPNGFHFPQAYVPPKNPNQYQPLHLKQESGSALTLDQESELNNNLNDAANLNRATDSQDTIETKISPASRASHRNLNSTEPQSLANLEEEENLIVMDDLSCRSEDREDRKENEPAKENEQEKSHEESVEESRMRSQNSSYTIATAAEILKASNENELAKLKSSTKPIINNQDSQPLTGGTLTGGTLTENHSKSSSTRSSSTELNADHEMLTGKSGEIETPAAASESKVTQVKVIEPAEVRTVEAEEEDEEDEDESEEAGKPYSPNEDVNEERYEESPTSSNDSLSPYESNQNTVSSYTQLLEKDKNNGEY